MKLRSGICVQQNSSKPGVDGMNAGLYLPYEEQLAVRAGDGQLRVTTVKSPKEFIETVEMLPPNKIIAVCGMGLGSVQLIGCPVLCRSVCQLMVEGIDPLNEKVRIHGKEFSLKASDFAHIMGLKDGGIEVEMGGDWGNQLIRRLSAQLVGDDGEITITSLKKIVLQREGADGLFKVAYAMFAMATLLCPGEKDEVDRSLIFAMKDFNMISSKNWASYCWSKLLSSVLMFKSNQCANITGCILFLQLVYFEIVGTRFGWVDRTVTPLLGWGVNEARRLVRLVDDTGGFIDANINVWSEIIIKPGQSEVGVNGAQASTNNIGCTSTQCASKADHEALQAAFNILQQTVCNMQSNVAEMKLGMGLTQRTSQVNDVEYFEKVVLEVGKRMGQRQNCGKESPTVKLTNTIAAVDKSSKLENVEYDGRRGQQQSGSYSLKLTGYRNAQDAKAEEAKVL